MVRKPAIHGHYKAEEEKEWMDKKEKSRYFYGDFIASVLFLPVDAHK